MKPTLYADDLEHGDALIWNSDMNDALKRILPRRCPRRLPDDLGGGHTDIDLRFRIQDGEPSTEVVECHDCDGRGWLYPDLPDDWDDWGTPNYVEEPDWEFFCLTAWRTMGILEDVLG